MKIKAQTDNRICIELTHEDMLELDITYDELDYSNIETRRVLWTLLDEARLELGRNISLTQKMLIEAIPDNNGGCRIYFTVTDEQNNKKNSRQIVKHGCAKTVCQSSDINHISELAKVLFSAGHRIKSELFTDGANYRLVISPDSAMQSNIDATVCEFCDICDESSVSYTYEHWKLLASPDAVGILAVTF
ncbi:MAG: adaptor protein MecA [Clostridia bacterium]|nr:adaptor protein MecA [Clostridia bacterium]